MQVSNPALRPLTKDTMNDIGHYKYLLAGHEVHYTIENSGTSGTNSYQSEEAIIDGKPLEDTTPELFEKLSRLLSNNTLFLTNARDFAQREQFYNLLSKHANEDGVCVLD